MPMDPKQIELLNRIRQEDNKEESGEKESLNSLRLEKYVAEQHINAENFDEKFTVDTALGYLREHPSRGEAMILKELEGAHEYMKSIGFPTLFDNENPDTFRSELNRQLVKRNAENREQTLFEVYEKYQLIRQLAERKIKIKKRFSEERKDEMSIIGESVTDQVKDTVKDISRNFRNMSGKEKLLTVGGLVLGTVLVYNWAKENETMKKIAGSLWTGIKYGGAAAAGAITLNYAYKLFTGKTAAEELELFTTGTTGSESFWTETFRTDPGSAEILRNSTIYLGDKKFSDLARRYREAKAANSTNIEMTDVNKKDMSGEDIYKALDVFFSRYEIGKLEEKYKDQKDIVWENVIAAELAEDNSIQIKEDVWDRIKSTVDEGYTRGINWLVAGEGFGVMKDLYKKYWGIADVNDDNVREWTKELFEGNEIQSESELEKFIDRKFTPIFVQPGYKEVAKHGTVDTKTGVKYYSKAGDSIYVLSRVSMQNCGGDREAVKKAFMTTEQKSTEFLKDRFPQASKNIYKFLDIEGGVRVNDTSSFLLFVRMPLPGSPDFEKANANQPWRNVDQRRDLDIFGPNNKIEYHRLKEWDQQQLRLHFLLDSSQTAEIDEICKWFTDTYKGQGHKVQYVMEKLLKDDNLKRTAIIETGITQKFAGEVHSMATLEEKLHEIEDDAADDLKSSADHNNVMAQMKIQKGFLVRLAIMGDSDARTKLSYNPSVTGAQKTLIEDYELWCKNLVKSKNGV